MANPDDRLVLYAKCKEWDTLPSAGGIFDQDPEILEGFAIISETMNMVEAKKQKQAEREAKRK